MNILILKKSIRFSLLLLSVLFSPLVLSDNNKPNIIIILLDDLGWRDVGYMDNPFIETPNIDLLAHSGLIFTNAYSNAPNCAPSRAAIMSGQYAPRTHAYTMISGDMGDERLRRVITPPNHMYLETDVITLAEMLKSAGYRTAQIGKWNLGTGLKRSPEAQGFDINIAGERNGTTHSYFAPYHLSTLDDAPVGEYLTDRLTQEAIKIIKDDSSSPFFIYLSHFAPHFPFQAPEALIKKYEKKSKNFPEKINDPILSAMIESVDIGIGKILKTLKENNKLENTLIIFTSDNGGYHDLSDMQPLRGEKSLLYEGGIRVPFFAWWPHNIAVGKSNELIMGADIFPTLMRIAGIDKVNQTLDGIDLSPILKNPNEKLPRDAIYWYFPGYVAGFNPDSADTVFSQRPAAIIREGKWKLIQYLDSNNIELYNLETDIGEKINLQDKDPQKTAQLLSKLNLWLKYMEAPLPLASNPKYDSRYEEDYKNSWIRKIRNKLSSTPYGSFLREEDL